MKDEDSIFGSKPERLNELVFHAMEDSGSGEEGTPTTSLNALVEELGSQIDRYKLLRHEGTEEFYDLIEDPYEHDNLLDGRLAPEEARQHRLLREQVETLRAGTSSVGRYTVRE